MPTASPEPPAGDFATVRLALCQVQTEQWATEANLGRTLAALEQAAAQGAELAVTPECVLHGYGDQARPEARQRLLAVAEPVDGPRLQSVRDAARRLGLHVLIGFAERGPEGTVYNSAALLGRDGAVIDVYRKVHLRPFEDAKHEGHFHAGQRFAVHRLRFAQGEFALGTMICFDREVVESVRCLRGLGAELILCPLATDTAQMAAHGNCADNEMVTRCRAFENEVFIAVVNHAGRFNGGSFVVGPRGECLYQMGPGPGVHVLDVPVGQATMYHADPLGWMGWGYRRPEVYGRYLGNSIHKGA